MRSNLGQPAVRPIATTVALALCLLGCVFRQQVPLSTSATDSGGGCWLMHEVVDLIADPTSGTPTIKGTGAPLKWPRGYTARRAGTEVEVLDRDGTVVLTTGGRYSVCPSPDSDYTKPVSEWVIGMVEPCPDCELGYGID